MTQRGVRSRSCVLNRFVTRFVAEKLLVKGFIWYTK